MNIKKYERARVAAEAGGMTADTAHEFALDQATRGERTTIGHTPGPWKVVAGTEVWSTGPHYQIADTFGPHSTSDVEACRGNAAFIVRACNAHEGLLGALHSAANELERTLAVFCGDQGTKDSLRTVRAALARAEVQS